MDARAQCEPTQEEDQADLVEAAHRWLLTAEGDEGAQGGAPGGAPGSAPGTELLVSLAPSPAKHGSFPQLRDR